jgi:hypothetical protein
MTNPMKDDGDRELREKILSIKLVDHVVGSGSVRTMNQILGDNELDAVIALIQADRVKAALEAREDAIWQIMSPITEGLFDGGELFIKRRPIEDAIISMVGYEKYKALQEAVDAQQGLNHAK